MGAYYEKLFSVRKRANWLHSVRALRRAADYPSEKALLFSTA